MRARNSATLVFFRLPLRPLLFTSSAHHWSRCVASLRPVPLIRAHTVLSPWPALPAALLSSAHALRWSARASVVCSPSFSSRARATEAGSPSPSAGCLLKSMWLSLEIPHMHRRHRLCNRFPSGAAVFHRAPYTRIFTSSEELEVHMGHKHAEKRWGVETSGSEEEGGTPDRLVPSGHVCPKCGHDCNNTGTQQPPEAQARR